MFEKRVWAVVVDGSHARIFKNIGHSSEADTVELNIEHPNLQEIMSDKAGRSFASVGQRRSGMELSSDPVRENERAFVHHLVSILDHHRLAGEIDELILVAAPQTLGDFRRALPVQLQQKIKIQSNKNLTGLPEKKVYEVIERLRATNH